VPLRGAIIGYGLAGSVFHAPLVTATPGLEVGAVVTSNPERQARAGRDHPEARVLASPDDVFEHASDHDFVVVASPNDSHAPLAHRALDADLPVVVDKPLATNPGDARDLVERAQQLAVPLTVFMNRRWDSDQLTLRRLLAEDRLGRVLRYESRFERWRPKLAEAAPWRETSAPEAGGGVLLDLGSHLVDQALVLFGPVAGVYAEIEHRRAGPADDDAFLALQHESGATSHLWCSSLAAIPGPRLRVLGDRAGFAVTDLDGQEDALRAGRRPSDPEPWGVEPSERWGRVVDEAGSEPVESEPGDWPGFYSGFAAALQEGATLPVDPADAVVGLQLIEAARHSAAHEEVVSLR
jgi:scyllo-inositol 2-dehydrogenase (NADP+)